MVIWRQSCGNVNRHERMLNMKIQTSRSRGTRSCSTHPNSKQHTVAPKSSSSSATISKYFIQPDDDKETTNCLDKKVKPLLDSPYKKSLTEINANLGLDDSVSDFQTPDKINKIAKKIVQLKPPPPSSKGKKQKKSGTARKQLLSMKKAINDHSLPKNTTTDVNPNHLQLAIALSLSSYESENPMEFQLPATSITTSPDNNNSRTVLATLEQFGFKSGKNKVAASSSNHRSAISSTSEVSTVRRFAKKSRYKHVTPVLYIRSHDDRESLIASKIALILNNNKERRQQTQQESLQLYSDALRNYNNTINKIYRLNNMSINDLNSSNRFYTALLSDFINPTDTTNNTDGGRLLKNWRTIAGRDPSPDRTIASTIETVNTKLPSSSYRCITPDLFDSEPEEPKTPPGNQEQGRALMLSPSLINYSPSKSRGFLRACNVDDDDNNKRIFPSNNNCFDLTKSSDDDDDNINNTSEPISLSSYNSKSTISDLLSNNNPGSSSSKIVQEFLLSSDATTIKNTDYTTSDNVNNDDGFNNISQNNNNDEDEFIISDEELNYSNLRSTTRKYYELSSDSDTSSSHRHFSKKSFSKKSKNNNSIKTSNNDLLRLDDYNNCSGVSNRNYNASPAIIPTFPAFSFDSELDRLLLSTAPIHSEDLFSSPQPQNDRLTALKTPFTHKSSSGSSQNKSDKSTNNSMESSIVLSGISKIYSEDHNSINSHQHVQQLIPETEYSASVFTELGIKNQEEILECYELSSSSSDSNLELITTENEHSNRVSPLPAGTIPTNNNTTPSIKSYSNNDNVLLTITPTNNFLVKTDNVTPMVNYDAMDTPKIVQQLAGFGLKPLKRQRGAKLLKYIYESTHPLVVVDSKEQLIETNSDDDDDEQSTMRVVKKMRKSTTITNACRSLNAEISNSGKSLIEDMPISEESDLIFERKQSVRIASCRIPLHIVWHNFILCNPKIRENILLYEPIQLEVLHSMLKSEGYKFHIQDLLTFLDKKCITIRTNQNGSRNSRRKK